ncbi:MAG: glycosyltransferase family 9 protein [Bacteroidota bacterium]
MKFLIIQTAFIGDVVLATPMAKALKQLSNSEIHFLVRKGNESILDNNPFIDKVWLWEKRNQKLRNLVRLSRQIRKEKFDVVINLQRFASSGYMTWLSGAKEKIGFSKNPFSFCYSQSFEHTLTNGLHEVNRNLELISNFISGEFLPQMFPSDQDWDFVSHFRVKPYVCIAPSSVWTTKQWPSENYSKLILELSKTHQIFLLGAKSDLDLCNKIACIAPEQTKVLCGLLSFQQSAALMSKADMNYVNDSAPLHFASAMNAPVTALFCSTTPNFGFGPLSKKQFIWQSSESLPCKPCGTHGKKECPMKHFNCGKASDSEIRDLAEWWK